MTRYECEVAVLGAGPTGLTIANLLGRAGVQVILIERNTSTVGEPRAVSIDDESLRTMQATGLLDEMLGDFALDYGSYYYPSVGGTRFLAVQPDSREYGFPKRSAFSQPKLEAALRKGLERFANVRPLFGCDCLAVEENAKCVVLSIRDLQGRNITVRARYLSATDGGRSMTRKHIGASFSGSTYKQRWLIVDLASSRERMRQTRVNCDPARPFVTLPGPGGIRRYEFLLHDHEAEESTISDDRIRRLLAENGPDADEPIVRRQVYTFHARIADRWHTERVFLAGDSAHLSPPFAGQGMNSGIRDAHNLAWKLASVVKGELGPGLLTSYQDERLPHATALIELAVRIGEVMVPRSRIHAWLIQSAFRAMRFIPSLQAYFAQMKYKPKPYHVKGFVCPNDEGLRLSGRMIVQPLVETLDRKRVLLDELLGDGCHVVAYGHDAQKALERVHALSWGIDVGRPLAILPSTSLPDKNAPSGVEVVRDADGLMAKMMPTGKTVIMLLRPDRYVAAATTRDADVLAQKARGLADACGASDASQALTLGIRNLEGMDHASVGSA